MIVVNAATNEKPPDPGGIKRLYLENDLAGGKPFRE
jgi:hypothetical protein